LAELATASPHPVSEFHLPKGSAERRALECTERLDIAFDLGSPGLIILAAATGTWDEPGQLLPDPVDDAHAPHRIELIPPGSATAVAQRSTETPESNLVYEVPEAGFAAGRWTARLTSLGTQRADFGFYVSYPTARTIHFADLPPDVFAEIAHLRLEFQRGKLASRLELDTQAGPVVHYFTVDEIEYWCPWMPRVMAHVEDVRSSGVKLSVPEGTTDPVLRCELTFEDDGLEIQGTIPLDLRNMRLTLDLPILVRHSHLADSKSPSAVDYDPSGARVTFTCEPQFEGLVEWLPGFFPMWRRLIQRTVEDACRSLLATYEVRKLLSRAMEMRVSEQLGPASKPVGVVAADGRLRFSYYTI